MKYVIHWLGHSPEEGPTFIRVTKRRNVTLKPVSLSEATRFDSHKLASDFAKTHIRDGRFGGGAGVYKIEPDSRDT